jgi:hypothetical protein
MHTLDWNGNAWFLGDVFVGGNNQSDATKLVKMTDTVTTTANGLMLKTDKEKLDNTNIAYGTCSTAAATAAKVITISGNTNWALKAGAIIIIKFSNTNTANSPTFNVNGTGAKRVWYGTALIGTSSLSYAGYANRPMKFVYDGTQYIFMGWSYDANSDTKVTQAAVITTNGEYPVMLGYSTATTSVTNTLNKAATFTYNPNTDTLSAGNFNGTALKATQDSSGNKIVDTYATKSALTNHTGNTSNPHSVTKAQVGLGNVPNVATNDQTPTFTTASSRTNLASGEKLSVSLGKISKYFTDLKAVAFSGSYNDLTNTPTIPTKTS